GRLGLAPPGSASHGISEPSGPLPARELVWLALLWSGFAGALVAQRDLGGAALVALLLPAGLLLAGYPARVPLGALLLAGGAGLLLLGLYPHALARVEGMRALWRLETAGAYQLWQGLASLALGGPWGRPGGFGDGLAVPAGATDLPLAVVAPGAGLEAVWGILSLQWSSVAGGPVGARGGLWRGPRGAGRRHRRAPGGGGAGCALGGRLGHSVPAMVHRCQGVGDGRDGRGSGPPADGSGRRSVGSGDPPAHRGLAGPGAPDGPAPASGEPGWQRPGGPRGPLGLAPLG